jgi:hypothetical protein
LAIVCTMVKVHQSNIPPSYVWVTLKTQQISELGGLDPPTYNITDKQRSSYFSSIT